jgi:hypothetical protein
MNSTLSGSGVGAHFGRGDVEPGCDENTNSSTGCSAQRRRLFAKVEVKASALKIPEIVGWGGHS